LRCRLGAHRATSRAEDLAPFPVSLRREPQRRCHRRA